MKGQKGKGRIKKIAMEQGLAQSKEKQAQGPSIGSKCQIDLLFAEGDENTARKKKREGFDGCIYEEIEISAMAAMQHQRRT